MGFLDFLNKYWTVLAGIATIFMFIGGLIVKVNGHAVSIKRIWEKLMDHEKEAKERYSEIIKILLDRKNS